MQNFSNNSGVSSSLYDLGGSQSKAASTIYVADLPRKTSYIDLAECFEKQIGPCEIIIKRYDN
jgi:hypothetical protein